jgi:hypothetical protein
MNPARVAVTQDSRRVQAATASTNSAASNTLGSRFWIHAANSPPGAIVIANPSLPRILPSGSTRPLILSFYHYY